MQRAHEHRTCKLIADWPLVASSVESRSNLWDHDGRIRIRSYVPYENYYRNFQPLNVDEGHNVTVNGDRYRAMITNFFIPELNNHDVQELWIQQDGATCHTARATIDLLKDTFGDRLISRFGPVNWPPRSCEFNTARPFSVGLCNVIVLCG
ncbi:heat shock 70kDa protein 8 [Trichonephila clavipes]|nr:heat shock 70kDa protein 8 [Trichonephila clavipes]